MKKIIFLFFGWFFLCGLLSSPPVDRDLSTQTRNFLYELYDYVKGLPTSTGTGTGTTTTAKESGSQVGGADIVTFDFGSGFDLTESPDTEINVALDLTEYSGYNSYNWDTAYGWGNHASAGYLATAAIDTFSELDTIVADKVLVETTTAFGGDVTGNIGATVVGNDTHDHSAAGSTVTINAADITDKNAGTDITADLEEEVTEGSLADSTIVSADIKDGVIIEPDLSADSIPDDGDILTYDSTGTNFEWITQNAGTDITANLEEEVIEGSLADSTIVSADIKNGTIVVADTAITAGRSLTWSTDDLLADAELYTDWKGMTIETPTDADNFFAFEAPIALTVTRVTGIVEAATSAVLTWQECDSAGDNCSTIEGVTADVDGTISTSIDNASIDAGDIIRLDVGTVTGTVGQAHSTITFTKND